MDRIRDIDALEDLLSTPGEGVVAALRRHPGDVLVLGVGGKMGPTLARMVRRGSDVARTGRRVIGVSRFGTGELRTRLERHGIETLTGDLLDEAFLAALPEAPLVVFMAGMKFGSTGNEPLTWAMNTWLPARVAQRFRHSRIVAFSTGNVYGLSPVSRGGSVETDAPRPVGEYAMSCLGRERLFEHFSRLHETPLALIRLNYAVEMRYGVLVDIGRKVISGEPIDLGMGHVNVIWQGDANAMAIEAFDHASSPPCVLNVTGPEVLSVRELATGLGLMIGREPVFIGRESGDALLSNPSKARRLLGEGSVGVQQVMHWVVDWLQRGQPLLGKPTHFEARDGRF